MCEIDLIVLERIISLKMNSIHLQALTLIKSIIEQKSRGQTSKIVKKPKLANIGKRAEFGSRRLVSLQC